MSRLSTMLLAAAAMILLVLPDTSDAFGSQIQRTDFLNNYARAKTMAGCYGHDTVAGWKKWMSGIARDCKTEVKAAVAAAAGGGRARRHSPPASDVLAAGAPFFSEEVIRSMKQHMELRKKYLTCIVNKTDLTMATDGGVDYSKAVVYFNGVNMNEDLRAEIMRGLDRCQKASRGCDGVETIEPMGVDLHKQIRFLRCDQENRLISCVRYNLKNSQEFELQGLDGFLDFMPDDTDKMMSIVYGDYLQKPKFIYE